MTKSGIASVGQFSVLIEGLPKKVTAKQVYDFFSQFGEVFSVLLLNDVSRFGPLQREIESLLFGVCLPSCCSYHPPVTVSLSTPLCNQVSCILSFE